MKGYTSIEQSEKLLEIGLNPSTADMSFGWAVEGGVYTDIPHFIPPHDDQLPCWSLEKLMDILPIIKKEGGMYVPLTYKVKNHVCKYESQRDGMGLVTFTGESYIDVVVEMVCWLLENCYMIKMKHK